MSAPPSFLNAALASLVAVSMASAAPVTVDPIYGDGFEPFACSIDDDPRPNEGAAEEPGTGGCPAGMIAVATFCIDRYEAALLDISGPGAPVPWSPYRNPGTTPVRALSARFAVPQGYISGVQAEAACQAAGKRLCSNQEWLRACRGPASTTYPYGETRMPGVCNDARAVHPAAEYFGTPPPWDLLHPCINQVRNGLDRAGTNPGCVAAEGPYDMMGNLHEWTSDAAGTFRGGYYVDTAVNGNGFRRCADP
jgi:hypothetical protein